MRAALAEATHPFRSAPRQHEELYQEQRRNCREEINWEAA